LETGLVVVALILVKLLPLIVAVHPSLKEDQPTSPGGEER
jgi:hypothetical protein